LNSDQPTEGFIRVSVIGDYLLKFRLAGLWVFKIMEVIKLGKKGQVSIPRAILNHLGLEGGTMLLVETTADGGILLRPAVVYPIEIYTEERIEEFKISDRLTNEEAEQLQRQLKDTK